MRNRAEASSTGYPPWLRVVVNSTRLLGGGLEREGRGRGGCEGGGMVLSDSIRRREGLGKPQVINCVPTLWLHTTTRQRIDTPGWWTVSTAHSTPAHHSVERHDR